MKTYKKILCVLLSLALALSVVALSACGNDKGGQSGSQTSSDTSVSESQVISDSGSTADSSSESVSESGQSSSAEEEQSSSSEEEQSSSSEEEQSSSSGEGGQEEASVTFTFTADASKLHTDAQLAYLADGYDQVAKYADGQSEKSKPLPAVITWSASEELADCKLLLAEDEDFGEYAEIAVEGEEISIYNLKVGTTYYFKLTATFDGEEVESEVQSFTTDAATPRFIDCDGVTNMRDLGGYTVADGKVRQGLIYRSGRLNQSDTNVVSANITEEGIATMRALGIRTEIDLRDTVYWDAANHMNEVGGLTDTSVIGEDINYYQCPININAGLTKSVNYASVRRAFEYFADETNYPIVYHCTIGTDRTGYISYLLNGLLGVSKEDLLRDYLFSNFGQINATRSIASIENLYVNMLDAEEGETLSEKIENYLVGTIGVSRATIKKIKAILIDGYPSVEENFVELESATALYEGEIAAWEDEIKVTSSGVVGAFILDGFEVDQGEAFMLTINVEQLNAEDVGFVVGTLGEGNANHVMFDWRVKNDLNDIYIWRNSPYGWTGFADNAYPCGVARTPVMLRLVYKEGYYYLFVNDKQVLEISEDKTFAWSESKIKDLIGSEGKIKLGLTASYGTVRFGNATLTTDADKISAFVPDEPGDPTVRPRLTTSNPKYSTSGENVSKEIANDVLTLKGAYYMRRAAVDNGSDFMVQMTFTAVSGAEYIFLLSDDLDNGRGRITFKNNKFNMYNYTSGTYKGVEWHWYDAIEARSNTAEALEDGKEYTLTLVHKNGKYVVFINGAQAVAFAETEELVSYGSKSDPVKHVTDIIGGGEKVYLGIGSVGKATTVTYWGYSTDADRINEFMPDEVIDPTVRPALTTSNPKYSTSGENKNKTIENDVLTLQGAYYMDGAVVDNGSDFMVQMTFTAVGGTEYIFLLTDDLESGRGRITFRSDNKFCIYNYTSGTYNGVAWDWYDCIEERANSAGALEAGKEYTLTLVHKNGKYVVFINGVQAVEFAETEELTMWGGKSDPVKHVTDIVGNGEKVYLGIGSVKKETVVTYWGYSTDAEKIAEFIPDEVDDPTVRPELTTSNPKYSTSGENKNKTIENDVLTLQGAYYMDGAVVDNGSDFMVQMTFTAVGGTEYIFLLTDDLESGRGRITFRSDNKFCIYNYTSGTYKDVAWNWYDAIEERANSASALTAGSEYTLTLVHKGGKYVVFINGVQAVVFDESEELTMWGSKSDPVKHVTDIVGNGEKVYLGIGALKETTVTYWGYSTDAEKIAEFIPDEVDDPTVRPELTTSNPKYSTSGENKNKTIENDVLTLQGAYYMDGAVVDNGSDFMVQMTFTAVGGTEYIFLLTDDLESGRGRITLKKDSGVYKFNFFNYTSGTYKDVAWNWYDSIERRTNNADDIEDGNVYTLTLVHKNGKYVVFINGVQAVVFTETEKLQSGSTMTVADLVGDGEKVYLGIGALKETIVTYWGYSTDAEKIAAFIPDEAQGGQTGGDQPQGQIKDGYTPYIKE